MTDTPTVRLNSTMAVFVRLGRMCLTMIRALLTPVASASLTKSRSRRLNTSPRMTRAYRVQNTITSMSMMVHRPGLNVAAKKMPNTSDGKANLASTTRMITRSQRPPMYPEMMPRVTPIAPANTVPSRPMMIDVLAPKMRRLRISPPENRCPRGCPNCHLNRPVERRPLPVSRKLRGCGELAGGQRWPQTQRTV